MRPDQSAVLIDVPAYLAHLAIDADLNPDARAPSDQRALYAFHGLLEHVLRRLQPPRLAAVHGDVRLPLKAPECLARLVRNARTLATVLAIPVIDMAAQRPQDVLASAAAELNRQGADVTLLSPNPRLCQLLGPRLRIHDVLSQRALDRQTVRRRWAIEPHQIPDYLALCGDPLNGIPNVPGIGHRTAAACLQTHDGLDSLLAADKPLGSARARAALARQRRDVLRRRDALRLDRGLDTGVRLDALRPGQPDFESLSQFYRSVGFMPAPPAAAVIPFHLAEPAAPPAS